MFEENIGSKSTGRGLLSKFRVLSLEFSVQLRRVAHAYISNMHITMGKAKVCLPPVSWV